MIINVKDEDKEKLMMQLSENNFIATHIASTGEFLQFGKSIFLLGVEDERVEEVDAIIKDCTHKGCVKEKHKNKAEWYLLNTSMKQG